MQKCRWHIHIHTEDIKTCTYILIFLERNGKKLEVNENVTVGGRCNWEERIATESKISNTSLYSFDFDHVNILHF